MPGSSTTPGRPGARDDAPVRVAFRARNSGRCPAYLLNIAKRSLPELILSGVGLASNDAVA
jgi:hypothetical protein